MVFHIFPRVDFEDEVALVLDEVPQFRDHYVALAEAADGDPGAPAVFGELAEYVMGLVAAIERLRSPLEGCMAALEAVVEGSEDAEELVVWSFFDNLSPDDAGRLEGWLGPRTRALLDAADQRGTPEVIPGHRDNFS